MSNLNNTPILCIIAGGEGTRLQHAIKCNLTLNGSPILEHIVNALRTQFFEHYQSHPSPIILNINRITDEVKALAETLELQLITDEPCIALSGPLAGIKTGLSWIEKNKPLSAGMITVAGDAPFLPQQFIQTLCSQAEYNHYSRVIYARSNQHPAYTTGFWPTRFATHIAQAISTNELALGAFHKKYESLTQPFKCCSYKNIKNELVELDPFFNINTHNDYILAQSLSVIEPKRHE